MAILIDNLNDGKKVTQEPFLCWINFFLMNTYGRFFVLQTQTIVNHMKQRKKRRERLKVDC